MDFKKNINARVVFFYAKITQLHTIPKPISCRRKIPPHSSSQSYHLKMGQYKYNSPITNNLVAFLLQHQWNIPRQSLLKLLKHHNVWKFVLLSTIVSIVWLQKMLQPSLPYSDWSTFLTAQQKLLMIRVLTSDN